tara:strand:+ start:351 stop:716 length:366 start_codon:yes stop_codon:yes gene_type:complete
MNDAEVASLPFASVWYLCQFVIASIAYRLISGESVYVGFIKLFKRQELGSEKYRNKAEAKRLLYMEPVQPRRHAPEDYWDGEEIDYDTGEVTTNTGPAVRHPKNRDRAYSGSVERFHDGGW